MALPGDDRKPKKNPLNDNFHKQEFQLLWQQINHKAVYQVQFDSAELVRYAIQALDKELKVTPLQYTIQAGTQQQQISDDELKAGSSFKLESTSVETHRASVHSAVKYDLLGKLAENTQLTRQTVGKILTGIQPLVFKQFQQNPEHFIAECSRIIKEQKATMIIEHLSYDTLAEVHDTAIFTAGSSKQDFTHAGDKLTKHIYDYVITDSKTERSFVTELDTSKEVVVYAKLPKGFQIPTPVGDYNPDWAIAFQDGKIKHIYFVAETKGSMSSLQLRAIEETKIECARKFFSKINSGATAEQVRYDVVTDYGKLMEIVT